jgi:hypothetical protein
MPHADVLALTYNARLKAETRRKAAELQLSNLEVHSFHAFGVKYYGPACKRDEGLRAAAERDTRPRRQLPRYAVVVVDETQDLTPLLHAFVCKLLRDARDAGGECRLLVMGDERQTIFQFLEADARFLTRAADAYAGVVAPLPWRALPLSTTFRLTRNMVKFLNRCVLGFPLFTTPNAAGPPVTYFNGSPHQIAAALASVLIGHVDAGRLRPEDIFVLAPSIRTGSASNPRPYNVLENLLVAHGLACYSPGSDEEALDARVIRDKIVFSTFHQVKGLERAAVVVFSFCADYFDVYARDKSDAQQRVCPNPIYMGARLRALHGDAARTDAPRRAARSHDARHPAALPGGRGHRGRAVCVSAGHGAQLVPGHADARQADAAGGGRSHAAGEHAQHHAAD